ncbi:MAG TPA: hypothetical protein VH684_11590 [Xanthobacteraceae bacterium]|jgi:hypothetical protein
MSPKKRASLFAGAIWAAYEAGRSDGTFAICNICDNPVFRADAWHVSHTPSRPRAFGGGCTGIAHAICNLEHAARIEAPRRAKTDRVGLRHIGAAGPGLGKRPMPAGKRSRLTKTFRNGVQPRLTHAEKHAAFLARRAIVRAES